MAKSVQITLDGRKINVQKGFLRRVRRAHRSYTKKRRDYEEKFRDLMRYGVIDPKTIQGVDDFRDIVNHVRKDGAKVITDQFVDALSQTFEFKEMVIEKLRYNELTLKSGRSRTGLLIDKGSAYLFIDSQGKLRARDLATGRFTKKPDYYDTIPLHEISRL